MDTASSDAGRKDDTMTRCDNCNSYTHRAYTVWVQEKAELWCKHCMKEELGE